MKNKPPIVLLTDFGDKDWYVGTLKAVIKSITPSAQIIDLNHFVDAFNVRQAAIMLEFAYSFFPKGTVFCCIIDPGVGSNRLPICATDRKYFFVAPDNGLLTFIQNKAFKNFNAFVIENPKYYLKNPSATFHGRDIFAPVAAYINRGVSLQKMGKRLKKLFLLEPSIPYLIEKNILQGEIIYIDVYGNLITNITETNLKILLQKIPPYEKWTLKIKNKKIKSLSKTFSSKKIADPLFYWGSSGNLEIALNQRSATAHFNAKEGTAFQLILS